MRLRPITYIVVLLFVAFSCDKNENSLVDNRPVSYGIFVTNEFGSSTAAIWGEPQLPDSSKSQTNGYALNTPYPSPADGNMHIELQVPDTVRGRVWLERARWVMERKKDYPEPFVMEIIDYEFPQGSHLLVLNESFNCGGSDSGTLEQGFYRVYFETEDFYYWRDIYITGYLDGTPDGLKQYTNEFCDNREQ